MSEGIYIHGTEPSEQERLAGLNRITNAAFIQFLDVADGSHVLEVGSGLGLLAVDVANAAAGVHVVGVEISAAQIAAASSHPRVTFVQGDAHSLDFPDARFDLVYARYLLEHVADPEATLAIVLRRLVVIDSMLRTATAPRTIVVSSVRSVSTNPGKSCIKGTSAIAISSAATRTST